VGVDGERLDDCYAFAANNERGPELFRPVRFRRRESFVLEQRTSLRQLIRVRSKNVSSHGDPVQCAQIWNPNGLSGLIHIEGLVNIHGVSAP
jgi:hypothetical protein